MGKWTKFAGLAGLLAAALLPAACSDSVSPEHALPSTPTFAVTANQVNGVVGESGNVIIKGFNPTSPHHGDAIVATFYWFGSSNIITAVTDHLTNGTSVGNTYTPVEYVTSGGISMATYVATNVQNFPDPNPTPETVLVVQADLSQSVSESGIMLSSYTGVEPVFTRALGSHRSAGGSGSSTLTADPGSIAVGAGALAYGISMATGVGGHTTPAGFNALTTNSDAMMVTDGEYLVQGSSAGSVDPQWTWSSSGPATWLATVLALSEASSSGNQPPTAAFTQSCSGLACTFTNTSTDPDGSIASSQWTFGDGATSTAQSPSHTYAAGGTYTVGLTVTDNQGATNSTSHTVTVSPINQPPTAAFTSSCSDLACTFTNTSSDPDGSIASSQWTFGDGATSTAQSPSHTYAAGGTYTVGLTVTDNQGATNSVSHTVTVTAPNQAPVVDAGPNEMVVVGLYTLSASFSDPDNGPWTYTIDWGDGSSSSGPRSSQGAFTAGHTYVVPLTQHTITVTVTDSLGASGSASKVVTVIL